MDIFFNAEDVEMPNINQEKLCLWLQKVSEKENKDIGEINYIFCSDKYILEVNKQYLNHDYFTDIISFDYSEGNTISGDLFISLDTIKDNADYYKVDYDDELKRVIIHGVLHLLKYNDKTDAEQDVMTKMENESLVLLTKID